MAATVQKLTTTSYAVLGLLAVRPWTTYELAGQFSRGGQYWLRSRSKLFEEPKKLAVLGLAAATASATGNRPRTVYSITEPGRAALAAWLATPGDPPVLESEQLLKVFFADHGTRADLLGTIEGLRAWAQEELTRNAARAAQYLAGLGDFPDRAPILTLVGRFNTDFAETVLRWADWADGVVRDWPDDLSAARADRTLMERLAGVPGSQPASARQASRS